jgi:hypothetical protein
MPLMARLRAIFGPRHRRAAYAQPGAAYRQPVSYVTHRRPVQLVRPVYVRRRRDRLICSGRQRIRQDAYTRPQPVYAYNIAHLRRHHHHHHRRVYAY